MEPLRFRIYYDDDSTYAGDPFQAKPTGAIAVVQQDDAASRGFHLIIQGRYGPDAYVWKAVGWYGCDEMGLWDYLMTYVGPKAILFGRRIPSWERFNEIYTRAKTEGLGCVE